MQLPEVLDQAKKLIHDMTTYKPLAITGVAKRADGWHVNLETLELSRIPSATDILGDYELNMDDDGNLVRFERKRTRLRGDPLTEE